MRTNKLRKHKKIVLKKVDFTINSTVFGFKSKKKKRRRHTHIKQPAVGPTKCTTKHALLLLFVCIGELCRFC